MASSRYADMPSCRHAVMPEAVPRVRKDARAIARARRVRAARREARPRGPSGEEARAAARPSGEDACAASAGGIIAISPSGEMP
jgi:hypothetical protein